MSAKIDQSLDEILANQRSNRKAGRGRNRRGTGSAPVGGVRKSVRAAATKATSKIIGKSEPAGAGAGASAGGATKVIVSNLPVDVTEAQIKEYFAKIAGPIKRVLLTYGPNGQSRGVATIIFSKPASGKKALEANGTMVDKRSLKVEAVMDPNATEPKSLSDRITQPAAKPKKVTTAAKPAEKGKAGKTGDARAAGRGGRSGRGRGRNAGRPKPKTADELDAEMTDYFGGGGAANQGQAGNAAAAAPAAAAPAAPAAAPAGGAAETMDDIS